MVFSRVSKIRLNRPGAENAYTEVPVEYYSSHPPFNTASNIAIASVGTVALALQYGEVGYYDFLSCSFLPENA